MLEIRSNLLWIGNALDVREPRPLFDAGIAAVVDVAYEEPVADVPRQLIYCRIPLNDGGGNDPAVLLQTVQIVVDLLAAAIPTIVACSAGMSRSPTIAAFALGIHINRPAEEIIAEISASRMLEVKQTLWDDVKAVLCRVRSPTHQQ